MNVVLWAWACIAFWVGVHCAALHFIFLISLLSLISWSCFWHFGCFSFRFWNHSPWCVHIHATDQSVAMHTIRIVRILLLLLCLVPVSEQSESIWPLAEPCSKLNLKSRSTDSMRRGAGRGKPDGPKRLPISLGFKCAHCRNEFDSRHAMDIHRRHSSSFGTPCADPRNHKSMSFTERGDQAAGILRQHDTLGVLAIPAFFPQKMPTFPSRNSHNYDIIEY